MHDRVVVQAPAKVNLSLDITGTDDNGYHLVETVMHSIDLSDLLLISRTDGDGIRVTCTDSAAPEDKTNLAWKAANAFFCNTGFRCGLSIHIDKRIPTQAGLGGGSADAAAVLAGLNWLFETEMNREQLRRIGLTCGADVPFCIEGGCCLAEGIGEKLTPLDVLSDGFLCIAKPTEGISTAEAFHRYDKWSGQVKRPDTHALIQALGHRDLPAVGNSMVNVFDSVCTLDSVRQIRALMLSCGAAGAALSGSGSAVCGLFACQKAAQNCLEALSRISCQAFLSLPSAQGAHVLSGI